MRRRESWTIGAALGACLLAASCRSHETPEKPPTPVRLQAAEAATAGAGVRYSANIVAKDEVSLAFKQTGYLRDILKVRGVDGRPRDLHEGDRVEKGSVLARLREDEFADRVGETRSQLTEAEA